MLELAEIFGFDNLFTSSYGLTNSNELLEHIFSFSKSPIPELQEEEQRKRMEKLFADNLKLATQPQNRERIRRFIYPYKGTEFEERERRPYLEQLTAYLSFAALPLSIFGVELNPVNFVCQNKPSKDSNPIHALGAVYPKTGFSYSADFIRFIQREIETKIFSNPKWQLTIGIIADGATPIIPPNQLPKEVIEACTYSEKGQNVFRPDLFWTAGLSAILGQKTACRFPPEFSDHPAVKFAFENSGKFWENVLPEIKQYLNDCIAGRGKSRPDTNSAEIIGMHLNRNLRDFLVNAFQGIPFRFYPSGIIGIIVFFTPISPSYEPDYLKSNCDFFSTGDITLSATQVKEDLIPPPAPPPYQNNPIILTQPTIVDLHDEVKELLEEGTIQEKDLPAIAAYRSPLLGNLPNPKDKLLDLTIKLKGISTKQLWDDLLRVPSFRCAVMYTDGLVLHRYAPSFSDSVRRDFGYPDYTAKQLALDPYLTLLSRRFLAFLGRNQPLLDGNLPRRPDDGAFLIIGKTGYFDPSFAKPIFPYP